MNSDPLGFKPAPWPRGALSAEEPHISAFPTIGRYKPAVSIVDDYDTNTSNLTYRIEETIGVFHDKVLTAEEDLIANNLISSGWTPPPGSRWSSYGTIPEELKGRVRYELTLVTSCCNAPVLGDPDTRDIWCRDCFRQL